MPVMTKTLGEFADAIRDNRVMSVWGTALIVYALVATPNRLSCEMWTVTP